MSRAPLIRLLLIVTALIVFPLYAKKCDTACSLEVASLKQTGLFAMQQGDTTGAIRAYSRAYQLKTDPEVALHLAYCYHQLKLDRLAFHYFHEVIREDHGRLALRAENALTRLVGLQTKAFSVPYYGEWFSLPFTQNRFSGLTATQFIGRLGVEQDNAWQTKEYFFIRRTADNKSKNLGELSQIYEDNVQLTGMGVQSVPLAGIPVMIFGEMSAAYDLIDQNRAPWRSDFRGGVIYFQLFGRQPAYFNQLRIQPDYYCFFYGDITYFSRYHNNVIGLFRTHQGLHVLQYKSSIFNVYIRGLLSEDTQRDFSNNYAEIGPGIGFIPSNRWNLEFRLDYIRGVYLPAGRLYNPYGKYYSNVLAQALFYVRV
jgi:tetratricopeptide (TPR) repeat protein